MLFVTVLTADCLSADTSAVQTNLNLHMSKKQQQQKTKQNKNKNRRKKVLYVCDRRVRVEEPIPTDNAVLAKLHRNFPEVCRTGEEEECLASQ